MLGSSNLEGLFDDRFDASEGLWSLKFRFFVQIKKTLGAGELTSITSNQEIDAEIPGELL